MMERRWNLVIIGLGATVWGAVRLDSYLELLSSREFGNLDLPVEIRAFFVAAIVAGLAGGVALSFGRCWAANLLWLSCLGVLIEGSWGPGLLSGRLDLGVTELLLTSAFALAAQRHSHCGARAGARAREVSAAEETLR
jgi:hypothetical protein